MLGNKTLKKRVGAVYCALILITFTTGCGGGGGGTPVATVVLTNQSVSPAEVFPGETVVIQTDVTATEGVSSVTASVTKPDSTVVGPIPLTLRSGTANTYQASYGSSSGQLDLPGSYSIVVTANDNNSNSAQTSAFTFSIESPPQPPP